MNDLFFKPLLKLLFLFLGFFLIYVILVQPLISAFFEKDRTRSETVLVKVLERETGNYDLGVFSKYTNKYEVEVYRRDGWIGYIDKIYSNTELTPNTIYGLEINPVESSSWFDFFLIPSIWSNYVFDISDVYNSKEDLQYLDFQHDDHDKLFQAIEDNYSFWNSTMGD